MVLFLRMKLMSLMMSGSTSRSWRDDSIALGSILLKAPSMSRVVSNENSFAERDFSI